MSIEEHLARARREALSDVEREELGEAGLRSSSPILKPLNPRNEAAALSAILCGAPTRLAQVVVGGGDAARSRRQELDALAASYMRRTGGPVAEEQHVTADTDAVDEATATLAAWALGEEAPPGAPPAAVAPAVFSDPSTKRRWRGLVATRDLSPGEAALSLPLSAPKQAQQQPLAITYSSARSSDLGKALAALSLDDESLALLFTMADRHDPDSYHAPFWRALPQDWLGTPLGVGVSDKAVEHALGGTPLGARCAEARTHLQKAYASLLPAITALVRAYPQHLKAAWFSRGSFLWAAELWYAYAMQLALSSDADAAAAGAAADQRPSPSSPSSSSSAPSAVPALVPFTSLANHSAWPHAVAYSDCSTDGVQRVRVFRPVLKGEELLISYGPHANDELLLFYGFALGGEEQGGGGGNNPFDARAVRRQLAAAAAGEEGRRAWRAAHERALARVEQALSSSDDEWTEREREFFGQARTFLRGFLAAEAAVAAGTAGGGGGD
jgi:hypothetical protein